MKKKQKDEETEFQGKISKFYWIKYNLQYNYRIKSLQKEG